MKLYELIADVIRDYKAPSLETLREWELMAIDVDEQKGRSEANALRANDFNRFLRWHFGADVFQRLQIKFIEWKEKQDGKK